MIYDMLVVGGGPCGYAAALYGGRAGLSVLLLEKLSPGGQMATTDMIDNYPGFPEGINGFDLAMLMKQSAERFGLRTETADVTGAELEGDIKVLRTDGGKYEGRTVVIATGASPKELGLERERELRGRGVSYCATCDGMFYRGKTVAVAGGGDTAAADALYLSRICEKIYLVHRRDSLRAAKTYADKLAACKNVEFVWNSGVTALRGEGKLEGVEVTDKNSGEKRELAVDGLFVAVGSRPNSESFGGALKTDERGYICADETTRTELPGVFAAGDVRTKALRQVVTAVADGAVAAHFAEEYLSMK